tara:strand:+ start:2207 stop:2671 length:465 start_codon:yes stop_codon:yes gene_type:complete
MVDQVKHSVTSLEMAKQSYRDILHMIEEHGWCTVEIKAGKRSTKQNSLYWEWMTVFADYVTCTVDNIPDIDKQEFSKEDMHDALRHSFLGYDDPKQIGRITLKPQLKSTTKATKGEMFHYMEQINAYAVGLGCLLPLPEDNEYTKLRKEHEGSK